MRSVGVNGSESRLARLDPESTGVIYRGVSPCDRSSYYRYSCSVRDVRYTNKAVGWIPDENRPLGSDIPSRALNGSIEGEVDIGDLCARQQASVRTPVDEEGFRIP